MKKLPLLLLLLIVVVLVSGCEEGAAYLASTSAAICISTMRIINGYADDTHRTDHDQISIAFSAWCWLPECMQTMNTTIGDNEELEELFAKLRLGCGNCWQTSDLPSYADPGIVQEIRKYCDGHTQYQPRPPEVIG